MTPQLVLGSASTARAAILQRAGIPFTQLPADIDEARFAADITKPRVQAQGLATAKAHAVVARLLEDHSPNTPTYVIAADSVFELDGLAYGKPRTPEVARQRWLTQRGRTGLLHSGHCVIAVVDGAAQRMVQETVTASVTFADASQRVINAYIATGEPLHVAGGFTLEGHGATMVSAVNGDPNAVLGLSLRALREMLARLGVHLTDLWTPHE